MSEKQEEQGQSLAERILWAAVDAGCVWLAWKYIMVPDFGLKEIPFGHFFAVVAGLHLLANRLFLRLDAYYERLTEIRDIQLFTEQNNAHKYGQIADFLEKHFDKITRAATETTPK